MKSPTLRRRLAAGELLFGLTHVYPAPGIVEVMAPGWDILWIDGQHGQFGHAELMAAVRACDLVGVAALVRVAGHESSLLGPVADMAPAAMMAPMVNSAEEAAAIARALRFPPLGERSYGGRRVGDLYGREYPNLADLLVVAQIEAPAAVEASADIAAVEGIDVLFLGPDDMKLRLGLPIETPLFADPRLASAATRVASAARAAGKFAAMPGATPENVARCRELGYQMFFGGSDVGFLRAASPAALKALRQAAG